MADYALQQVPFSASYIAADSAALSVIAVGDTPVIYYQRVWSTGTSVWCYYQSAAVNPTPLSTATTPNWVGSATNPSVVAIF